MFDTIINVVIVFLLVYLSFSLWKRGKRVKENGLLLKMLSLFVLTHVVIFPIIYVLIINTNPNSIEINNDILSLEKEERLKNLETAYNNYDIENQRAIIEEILHTDSKLLKKSNVHWFEYYDIFNDEDSDGLVTKNSTLFFYERYKETPSTPFGRFIVIYPKNKNYKKFEINGGFNVKAIDILKNKLSELKLLEKQRDNQLKVIKSNRFWSYKQVLPYTINILFTDSFKPKSGVAHIIHFLHNIIVAGFILSFIMNLSQNYIMEQENKDS